MPIAMEGEPEPGFDPEYERRALYSELQDVFVDQRQADTVTTGMARGNQAEFIAGTVPVQRLHETEPGAHKHGVVVVAAALGGQTPGYQIAEKCPNKVTPFLHRLPRLQIGEQPEIPEDPATTSKDVRARWLIDHTKFTAGDSLIASALEGSSGDY